MVVPDPVDGGYHSDDTEYSMEEFGIGHLMRTEPYDECPNCNEYSLYERLRYGIKVEYDGYIPFLRDKRTAVKIKERVWFCENCKYTEDIDNE